MEDVERGLGALADTIRERGIRSIAIPPLGAGLGGLDWPAVRRRIEEYLGDFTAVRIILFEPSGPPEVVRSPDVPNMTSGRAWR